MINQIKTFLQNRQWEFEQIDDETIVSGFTSPLPSGNDHGFPLFFMVLNDVLSDTYLRLVIVPYVDRPTDGYSSPLVQLVSQVNHNLPLIKLAFDGEDELEMLVDIPENELTEERLNSSIQLLADYAGIYYADFSEADMSAE